MSNNDEIAIVLGVVEEADEVVRENHSLVRVDEDEFEEVKADVQGAIDTVARSLARLSDVCEQVATSEHFSALASLTNSYLNANKLKLALLERKSSAKKSNMPGGDTFNQQNNTTNQVFVGTTEQLLKLTRQISDENKDDIQE